MLEIANGSCLCKLSTPHIELFLSFIQESILLLLRNAKGIVAKTKDATLCKITTASKFACINISGFCFILISKVSKETSNRSNLLHKSRRMLT